MSDQTRGITDPDLRRVVREALASGWEWCGFTGTTHCVIRWPSTGDKLRFGTTPSVASWKSLASDIKRVSGVEVWRRGNRKPSRKADQVSGFDLGAAAREQAAYRAGIGGDIAELQARHGRLKTELATLAAAGDRTAVCRARKVFADLADIEANLTALHAPFEPFTTTAI